MRFVFAIILAIGLSGASFAGPWDIISVGETSPDRRSHASQRPLHMQRGGSSDTLQTLDSLSLAVTAKGLGTISAMAVGPDGTLYAADRKSGRIWALPDRALDGTIDQRRPLPMRFENPSGLAVIGETLYVADRRAIWKLAPGQEAAQLASLTNAKSQNQYHPLADAQDGQNLLLGLTTIDGTHRILSINIETGRAALSGQGEGVLYSLSKRKGATAWISSQNRLAALSSAQDGLTFNAEQKITSLALPGQFEMSKDWPAQLKDHIIAAQTGPEAMRLIAIPTEFGQPSGDPRILLDGFLSHTKRSAWGTPGPIVMDRRGLFFADSHNGTVWRLSPKGKTAPPKVIAQIKAAPEAQAEIKKEPSALLKGSGITGSQMGSASTLESASQLKVGSTLIEAYDKKKAEEEKAKAEKEKSKKTFRQR